MSHFVQGAYTISMGGVSGPCCISQRKLYSPYVRFIFVLRVKPFHFEGQRHFSQKGRLFAC